MPTPHNDDVHIRSNKGNSVLPGTRSTPAYVDSAAPPAIEIDPPKPDAAPAKYGRTDNIPAVAFGIHNPLLKPIKIINPIKPSTLL